MVHRSTLLNWLKTKIDGISKEDEADNVHIECSLIRAISEYREKELANLKLDSDFEKRLMNRLEHIDLETIETYSYENRRSYRLPLAFSAGFAIVAAVVTVGIYNSEDGSNPQFNKFPAYVTPIGLKSHSYSKVSEEEALIQELKNHPENVRLLEKLENYYSEAGKKEQATEIHSVLETVSKKY